ncbi:FAS-associated factor 1 [Lucilia cuprina]|uniref:FAS-associated factor 1 n=1 Tax=Lucilia cuprina TaxID=7375 RepID=UPI001F0707D8|nr:FAS-associated factor 1 [Lucilia cuprina]XP_046809530.1 FAS-associated factor 1 [Lucilia cuprina]
MSENKDEILANFQSITGIDDVGEAFSHLEDCNWDLMAAIQRVIPQDDPTLDTPVVPSLRSESSGLLGRNASSSSALNNFSTAPGPSTRNCPRWLKNASTNNLGSSAAESAFVPVASTSSDADIIDLTSDMDIAEHRTSTNAMASLSSSSAPSLIRQIIFNIHFDQQIYDIRLPSTSTIEQLKNKIHDVTGVPICRQAIRGWPPAKLNQAQIPTTQLSSLGLSGENELILIDLTEEGYMDFENDEVSSRLDKNFVLTIVQQPSGVRHELNFSGRTTIEDVKTKVYYVTEIAVRHQEWTGWPHGCDNETTLAQSGIQLNHNFILHNAADKMRNNTNNSSSTTRSSNAVGLDTDSSADEFEDASDFNACEEFFTDPPPVQSTTRHLIPNNTDSETTGSLQFVENYKQRFGEPCPFFFTGSLEDALKEACHKPARERKLLAIYLHHGESILTNVFCDRLMKHESILQTFAENFIVYGWDLTHESNKHLFLSSVTGCISNTASMTVRNISIDKLPSILVIGKSRLSGRTSCEILSVIHGNVGLDDLLSRLLESVEMYNQHLQGEISEEDARAARDQVKAEQDMAYQETLQADIAKEAAKRQKEAALAAERQRLESEKAEEDARRESIRLVAEQSLPKEPAETETNISKIRVRKPTGDFLERRFYANNTLQDLLNYVASNGFLIDEFKLISSWPRRDLTSIDAQQTLQALKLYPQETVILEER